MGFNEKAKDWDKDPKKVERAGIFAQEILGFTVDKNLPNAIEFGSGTGLVSFQLRERFKSITLADNSPGMMEVLKEKIRNENITNMKPFLIDSENDLSMLTGFDVIFTLLTLHHIKDIEKLFWAFFASLNRGGYLFIGDLVTEDGSFHGKDTDFDGHKGFDREMLKNRLALKGFATEADKIFMEMEKENNGILKKYPLFFMAAKKL